MKLQVDQPEAAKVLRVLVDGKPVAQAVSLDTDAGWVDVVVPKVDDAVSIEAGGRINIKEEFNPEFEWETKRLFGKVEVVMVPEKK